MSFLEAALPSDSGALRAFGMALPADLYAKTVHLEKLKAQLLGNETGPSLRSAEHRSVYS